MNAYTITNKTNGETKTARTLIEAEALAEVMLKGEEISMDIISIIRFDGSEYEAFMTDNGDFVVEEL